MDINDFLSSPPSQPSGPSEDYKLGFQRGARYAQSRSWCLGMALRFPEPIEGSMKTEVVLERARALEQYFLEVA